jgi:anti-sigma factor RsiW
MNCDKARTELVDGSDRDRGALMRHLERCPACARYSERLERVQEVLGHHHAGVTPDPAFAARVVARLPQRSPVLGWAALRLLPVATALLLVLSAWAWLGTGTATEMTAAAPTDDLVSWVLENGESFE